MVKVHTLQGIMNRWLFFLKKTFFRLSRNMLPIPILFLIRYFTSQTIAMVWIHIQIRKGTDRCTTLHLFKTHLHYYFTKHICLFFHLCPFYSSMKDFRMTICNECMTLFCFQHGLALRNHVLVIGSREEEQKEETDLKIAFKRP